MSSHGFQRVGAGLEQGFAAANGICLRDDPNTAARLVAVADNGESTLTVQTATESSSTAAGKAGCSRGECFFLSFAILKFTA